MWYMYVSSAGTCGDNYNIHNSVVCTRYYGIPEVHILLDNLNNLHCVVHNLFKYSRNLF